MTRERAESIRVYFVRASFRVALAKFRGFLFAVITRLHVCDFNSIRRDFSNIVVGCSAACIFPARFLVFFVLEKCLFRGFSISSMIDSVVHGKKFERSWSNCSSRSSSSSSPSIRSGGFVEILCHVFLTCFRSYYTFCRSNRELPLCDYKNIVSAWLSLRWSFPTNFFLLWNTKSLELFYQACDRRSTCLEKETRVSRNPSHEKSSSTRVSTFYRS